MKPINLLSLIHARNKLSPSVFEQYIKAFSIQFKEHELDGISNIIDKLTDLSRGTYIFDGFYVGFSIPQISKEFDLLRIGKESIINIELKQQSTGDVRMKAQLTENQYYLGFLEKNIHSYTYVSEDNQLFYFNKDEDTFMEIAFDDLFKQLQEQELAEVDDISSLFDPTNYLVSPFNSTDKFMEGQYFLTDHQKEIKRNVLKLKPISSTAYVSIEGAAGTGKTLLTYSIAKESMDKGKSVLIVHVGKLNGGHNRLIHKYKWKIARIKDYEDYDYSKYDVIIFDEVQRVSKQQLKDIIGKTTDGSLVIFSYDGEQCLSDWEIESDVPTYIKSLTPHSSYKLTKKIRTNKEIASFIVKLFDLKSSSSSSSSSMSYQNISVQYFADAISAKKYSNILSEEGWKAINFTPSRFKQLPADKYHNHHFDTAHDVIGQEFDNVIAFLDHTFYHTEEGKLFTRGFSPYYHPTKMLFQILTRTRKKLHLIIIRNEVLLSTCLSILGIMPELEEEN
ncbi:DNA/RNA helicase domain-containing protein [Paenibacillus lautus]|uniref:DNA/RNA helicase domain-containing protein n=1 Tax=Paenibacillus lautus TaxID=1401 RepID=UPI003D2A6BD7